MFPKQNRTVPCQNIYKTSWQYCMLVQCSQLEGIYTSAQSAQILSLENMDIGHLSPLRKTNGGISCFRHVCHLLRCFRGHWRGGRAGRQEFIFCGRALSIAQGSAPPECELVDTTFHALSTNGPGTATQSALPTLRGKAERQQQRERCKPSNLHGQVGQ